MYRKNKLDKIITIEFIWCKDAYTIFTPDKIVMIPRKICKNISGNPTINNDLPNRLLGIISLSLIKFPLNF